MNAVISNTVKLLTFINFSAPRMSSAAAPSAATGDREPKDIRGGGSNSDRPSVGAGGSNKDADQRRPAAERRDESSGRRDDPTSRRDGSDRRRAAATEMDAAARRERKHSGSHGHHHHSVGHHQRQSPAKDETQRHARHPSGTLDSIYIR